jgi:hypothetical protein
MAVMTRRRRGNRYKAEGKGQMEPEREREVQLKNQGHRVKKRRTGRKLLKRLARCTYFGVGCVSL